MVNKKAILRVTRMALAYNNSFTILNGDENLYLFSY